MRTRIYLEGINLDLYEDIDTTFTYVIDDVKEFGSRNTSFSKTIAIPGNQVNNIAFGNIFNIGSANDYTSEIPNIGYNFNAAKSSRCIIFIDQIQVFKGSLRLVEIIDTAGTIEYQCFVFGELGGFIFELGNRRLEDLDFSEYNETYNITNIKDSWDNIDGSGVAYPLIDYGNVSTDKVNFQYKAFRPALYVREYLEKIISGTSYDVESNFFLTALFDRLVIPHNQKTLTKSSSSYFTGSPELRTYSGSGSSLGLAFDATSLGSFVLSSGDTVLTNSGSSITTDIAFNVTGIWNSTGVATINLRKNGVIIGSTYLGSGGAFNYFTRLVSASAITIATSDYITVTIDWSGSVSYNLQTLAGSFTMQGATPTRVEVNINEALPINDTIPKGIFQKDFFIWILRMFNLMVYESQFDDKKLIITTFDEFISNNAATALDWSGKVDREKPISQTPMSELNARYYQYKFKEDNDFYAEDYRKAYNEGYGDFIYDTEFEFSKDTDVLEVGFSNSVLYKNLGTDKTYPAIYKLSGTTETSMDCNIRILQLKKKSCTSFNILNVATVLNASTTYLYGGHVDDPDTPTNDICFGAPQVLQFTPSGAYPSTNVFNTFHSSYISEITDKDSKLISCFAYLNTVDIMNLDFTKLIYVDGILFRLNKVNNYNPVDLGTTEIQLLKVINL